MGKHHRIAKTFTILSLGLATAGAFAAATVMVGSIPNKTQDWEQIQNIVGQSSVIATRAKKEKTGSWLGIPIYKDTWLNVLLVASDAQKATLEKLGFHPVSQASAAVSVRRVSDINGYGTGVNGEVHHSFNYSLQVNEGRSPFLDPAGGLSAFLNSPLATTEKILKEQYQALFAYESVAMFERGFVGKLQVTLEVKDLPAGLPLGQQSMSFEVYEDSPYISDSGDKGYFSIIAYRNEQGCQGSVASNGNP
jgi:hypothetical protein